MTCIFYMMWYDTPSADFVYCLSLVKNTTIIQMRLMDVLGEDNLIREEKDQEKKTTGIKL